MMEEFVWRPFVSSSTGTARVRKFSAMLGDGYEQLVLDGINPRSVDWRIVLKGSRSTIMDAHKFLMRHATVEPFTWRNPEGDTKIYRAEAHTISQEARNVFNLSVQFVEVFLP